MVPQMTQALLREMYGEHVWVSPWAATLPASYVKEFDQIIRSRMYRSGAAKEVVALQVFVRMAHAKGFFTPWLEEVLPLAGRRIIEVGCGTGSSTVAMLLAGAEVHALEIDATAPDLARERIRLLGIPDRFSSSIVPPDWLANDENYDWSSLNADTIVCYALLEHLTIRERMVFLYNAMRALPIGGHLVIYETPNRLAPVDWHSTHLPFSEILPDDLTQIYMTRCLRTDRSASLVWDSLRSPAPDVQELYRSGRGVSFHEFELAIGLGNVEIIQDGRNVRPRFVPLMPPIPQQTESNYVRSLGDVLEALGVPLAFSYTGLDLVLRKTAEPKRFDV
jgi:2-polyprenyl-3-methyl-5-hydroxy-6-metoxy-1,4-benzoquinol methylase